MNLSPALILDVYVKEVRSVLELAVPAWSSGLTKDQSEQIERVQKVSVRLILGDFTISYRAALDILGLETLQSRRLKICKNFAKKTLKSRHRNMFTENSSSYRTRNRKDFAVPLSHSKRAFESPLVYLTRLLNSNH